MTDKKAGKKSAETPAKTAEANVPAAAPAEMSNSQKALTLANGRTITIARRVTVPTLTQKGDEVIAFTVKGPMYMGKEIPGKDGKPAMAAATLVPVIDLNTDIEKVYVVPTVLKSQWEQEYTGNSYVGKSFMCQKLPVETGKRHRNMNIVEITV